MTLLLALQQLRHEFESPFPDWVDPLMRFLFTRVPQWVQIWGAVAALVVAVVLVLVAWRKRTRIAGWWRSRSRTFHGSAAVVAVIALIAFAVLGASGWTYVQGDNDFCNACHVMNVSFERFTTSEHAELQCHDCHRQPITASIRQVYLWVLQRPDEIGPHAPVPNRICAECHIQQDPDSTWQRIAATAGHRVHLEADTAALKDVMCVTCHGIEVHRFVPVDQTCGQSGCHDPQMTSVVLGDMAGQSDLHCVTCHDFTAPVPEHVSLDTARAALVPALQNCTSCHQMEEMLVGFDPRQDPHKAVCGDCHNPHTQELPELAAERCVECHGQADTLTAFHRGLRAGVLEDCAGCHEAHTFTVAGDDCVACHADILGGTPTAGPRTRRTASLNAIDILLRPAANLRSADSRSAADPTFRLVHAVTVLHEKGRGPAEPVGGRWRESSGVQRQQQPFDHRQHRDIACIDCHTSRRTHGEVTVESRTQCLSCHHSRPVAFGGAGCARCHGGDELAASRPVEVAMAIRGRSIARQIGFDHDAHTGVTCATCHVQGVTMPVERTCASCHADHHTETADCTTCHGAAAKQAHTREVHTQGCAGSGCHEAASYGAMTQGRNTCLACHSNMADHRPGRACAACHRVIFATGASSPVGRRR